MKAAARRLLGRLAWPAGGYGCPGDGCPGVFRTPGRAGEHGWVARTIGSHDAAPQRAFLRERNRQARQLRRYGRTR
jgi:hypothetical protein